MSKLASPSQIFGLIIMTIACNESSFEGRSDSIPPPEPVQHEIATLGMDAEVDGGKLLISSIDQLDLVIQAGDARILSEDIVRTKQPVDLMFVVDGTTSMADEIASIKAGIASLTSKLQTNDIDLHVGLVSFVDSYSSIDDGVFALSSDIVGFQNALDGIRSNRNEDYPEASLAAVQRALKVFQEPNSGRAGAMKTVFLISDVIGHNGSSEAGGKPVRDCSITPLANAINRYANTLSTPDRFKFFYLVPEPTSISDYNNEGSAMDCNGNESQASNAKLQMAQLIRSILPTVSEQRRGGAVRDSAGKLAWPLTSNNLVENLVPMIEESIDKNQQNGSCLASRAELLEGRKQLFQWAPENLSDISSNRQGANVVKLSNVLASLNLAPGAHPLTLEVERCCIDTDASNSNNNPTCERRYTQRISYDISVQQ